MVEDLPFIPVVYLLRLAEHMDEEHLDSHYVLREAGINPSVLTKPDAMLTICQTRSVLQRYIGLTAYSHPGLRYGMRLDLMTHGLFGFVFLTKTDFRELMSAIVHYLQVRFPLIHFKLTKNHEYFSMQIDCHHKLREIEIFVTQALLGSFYKLGMMITNNIRIFCQDHIISDTKQIHQLISVPVDNQNSCNEIRFYSKHPNIHKELPTTDQEPLVVDTPFQEHALVVRMRSYLLSRMSETITATEVASALGMSERTLRRKLADRGQNFNQIRMDVRMEAATRYLKTSTISIERIANLVGYSDQATFTRAYQKWANTTPDVVRKHHLRYQTMTHAYLESHSEN